MANKVANRVHSGHFAGTAPVGGGLTAAFNIPFTNREVKLKSLLLDIKFSLVIVPGVTLPLNIPEDDENLYWYLEVGNLVMPGDHITSPLVQTAGTFILNIFGQAFRLFRTRQYFFDSYYIQHLLPMNFYIMNLDTLNNIDVRAVVIVELEDVGII